MLQHRHARSCADAPNQTFAAARYDQVDLAVHLQQLPNGGTVRGRDELDGITGQAGLVQAILKNGMQSDIGVHRLLAAPQDDGIAAFDAQARRVHRDIGPGFVDEKDDA